MQKITWRKTATDDDGVPLVDDDGEDVVTTYYGKNLGPVVKDGVTCLVIWCDDSRVREVAIDDIIPY